MDVGKGALKSHISISVQHYIVKTMFPSPAYFLPSPNYCRFQWAAVWIKRVMNSNREKQNATVTLF